jgi:hypothetical protein
MGRRMAVSDTKWEPLYSGPGKSGVCRCGHSHEDHHGGIVMNADYFKQTGEGRVPGECEFYGCNEEGGLDADGNLHCGNYVDRGIQEEPDMSEWNIAENDDPMPPDDFTLTIQPATNGWIVRYADAVDVVEEVEMGEDSEARTTARLLWTVLDMLGLSGSKHDHYRVRVAVMNQQTDTVVE